MEAPKSELYSLSLYISWKILRKQHPIAKKLDEKIGGFVKKSLDAELIRPVFRKRMSPDIANPVIENFRKILEDFEHEDKQVKINIRHPFGVENFACEDREDHVVGQHKLTFKILNKTVSDYGRVLPLILKKIMKIRIETKEVLLTVTDYRTPGMVKINDSAWPKSGSTEF